VQLIERNIVTVVLIETRSYKSRSNTVAQIEARASVLGFMPHI